jgi:choline dehydrogenase
VRLHGGEPDVLIVGAGSAGCVLANRLSADPNRRVVLIEAGGSDLSPFIQVPAALIKAVGNPRYDWMMLAEPDGSRDGKVDLWPAGKVLGGSSAINGMLWVRGAAADYDRWEALGNPGWGWADMARALHRCEDADWGDPALRGRGGPMRVEGLRSRHALSDVFIAAAREAGLPANDDYNGAAQEGVALPQVTQKRGRRFSAARGYLHPVRGRSNLRVLDQMRVERLLIENGRCVGVEAISANGRDEIRAREVILCAGAMGSPKLLMLSGIGPAGELAQLGISPVLDQPLIGENLQDHPNATVSVDVYQRTYNVEINSPRIALHVADWVLRRRGPATSPYPHAVAFMKSSPELKEPDIQVMLGPFAFAFDEGGIRPYLKPSVTAAISLSYPTSAGRVRLRSQNSADSVLIEHQLLARDADVAALTRACRRVRDIFRSPAFHGHVKEERLPGPQVESDADWAAYLRQTTFLGYHPSGTVRMGPAGWGALDPDLRLRGIEGLRVVDASAIPSHMSGNINAAVIALAERAAERMGA